MSTNVQSNKKIERKAEMVFLTKKRVKARYSESNNPEKGEHETKVCEGTGNLNH